MSDDSYIGWSGKRAHPDSPLGGAGPGASRNPRSLGADVDPLGDLLHPSARIVLAQADAGAILGKKKDLVAPVLKLEQFSSDDDIGDYSVAEMNDALLAVFGEESPQLIKELDQEAKALASTILNRLAGIVESREAYDEAKEELDKAKETRDDAESEHDDLANHPSKYKSELGEKEYESQVAAAKKNYTAATHDFGQAQNKLNHTNSQKIRFESYVVESKRKNEDLTLSDIVEQEAQFAGYPKGQSDFADFPNMSKDNQERNYKRWNIAKSALLQMAKNPAQRDHYDQFLSRIDPATGKERPLKKGWKRIGGNVFWWQ